MMKRVLSAVLSSAMAVSAFSPVSASSAALSFGDPNGDGKTDAKDASFVLEAYSKLSTGGTDVLSSEQRTAANVNRDEKVDAKDASVILAYYAYLSTGGYLDFIKYSKLAEHPEYKSKYELLNPDTKIAAKAFGLLSDELRKELFNGYYVSDESYGMTAGYEQAKIILAALNYYNGGISPEALANNDALGELSRADMKKYCINLDLPQEQYLYGSRIDFNKYVIDDDFADRIESITDIYFDWKDNDNSESLATYKKEYFENNNYECLENVDNFAEFYYMCAINCEYKNLSHLMEEYKETLRENLIIPMYESYESYLE